MNLKYYLKGLGLGIIVTAIIMGVVLNGKGKALSDNEIKQRAAELGMVDGNSRLVDDEKTTEEMLEEITETAQEDSAEELDINEPETLTEGTDSNEGTESNVELADTETADELTSDTDSVIQAADEFLNDDPDKKEDTATEENSEVNEDINNIEETVTAAGGNKITITIKSGDSSYTVAKRLEEAGLVLNASDYDTYLCQYGYDRHIQTGTYEITEGASNEQIANTITGK